MNSSYPSLSATASLSAFLEQTNASLAETFIVVQKAEQRAIELGILIQDIERRMTVAVAGFAKGATIRSLLERERARLAAERNRLTGELRLLSDRVSGLCAAASRFAEGSAGLRTKTRTLLDHAVSTTENLEGVHASCLQLEREFQQADARLGGIEDAMIAIARRTREPGT